MRFLTLVALVNGCVVAAALGGVAMGEAVGYRRFDDGAGRVAGEPAVTGKPAAVR